MQNDGCTSEQMWLSTTNVQSMWRTIIEEKNLSRRKCRLYCIAVCHILWDKLDDERLRHCVKTAEQFVENKVSSDELNHVWESAKEVPVIQPWMALGGWAEQSIPGRIAFYSCNKRGAYAFEAASASYIPETIINKEIRPELMRDIFGNPFRPVIFDPVWLTPTVNRLAETAYDDRNFDLLPILADALEEAGCDNAEVLDHCRTFPVHVRGCWVVDSIVGKNTGS